MISKSVGEPARIDKIYVSEGIQFKMSVAACTLMAEEESVERAVSPEQLKKKKKKRQVLWENAF